MNSLPPPPPPPPPIHPSALLIQQGIAAKYLGVAGLVFLLYDHIISFGDEVELVWKAKWTLPKVIFLLLRYGVPCALIVHIYQLSALNAIMDPDGFCEVWFNVMVCFGMVTNAIGNFLVLLRLWLITNRNQKFIFATLILFVIAHVATITCVVIVLVNANPSLIFDPVLTMCMMIRRSILGLLYVPAVIFDSVALVVTFWNALRRPRSQEMGLMRYLRQDGFIFVLLLFLMRLVNFFMTLFGPLSMIFSAIYVVWATTTVTVSWLVLDFRRNGRSQKDVALNPDSK